MFNRHFGLFLVGSAYVAIALLSLTPNGLRPPIATMSDKLDHLLAYSAIMGLAGVAVQKPRHMIRLGAATVVYAGILEVGQSLIPGRVASVADFAASALGVAMGAALVIWVPKLFAR